MSAKTTFWYCLVVALAVIGSAVALPLSTNDDSASENGKTVVLPEQPKESVATESAQSTGQTEDVATVGSTDPSSVSQTVKTESADDGSTSTAAAAAAATATSGAQNTEDVAVGSTSAAAESATGSDQSEPTTPATATGSDSQEPAAGAHVHDQRPKPYNEDNAATVKIGPSMPFYLEFFQPFQPLPMQSYPNRQNQLPTRHQQPFGAIIDPFDPFGNSPMPPFNQIIEAYTNEFRKMLESFDQNMQRIPQQGENFDSAQSGSNKPVTKTTTKTEIINGHVVQINETTYTNGDENHKSFYHFKEIQVLPEANNKKMANEKLTSLTKDDSEKIEMNEIKRDPDESFDDVVKPVNQPGLVKKVE